MRTIYALPRPVRRLLAGRPIRIDGQELALDMQLLLRLQRLSGVELGGGDVAAARAALSASTQLAEGPRRQDIAVRDLRIPGADGEIGARLYTPDGVAARSPLLVFFHGGGFVIGDLDSHNAPCEFLAAEAAVRVLSVDYRMAPEHPFPAAADDAVAAFRYAVTEADALGADPDAIALGGDSAGGNLTAVAAHQLARAGGARPAFLLMFYPATDSNRQTRSRQLFGDGYFLTNAAMDWFVDHYAPDRATRTDERFAILHAADLSGLPPSYLATGGFDPLRDEGEAFGRRLADAGCAVVLRRHSDLIHGYINFLGLGPRPREALAEAAGALRTGLVMTRETLTREQQDTA